MSSFLPSLYSTNIDTNIENIYIDMKQIPLYQDFKNKINDKIKISSPIITQNLGDYIFLRLFRIMLYLDYLHDFADVNRTANAYFKTNATQKQITKIQITDRYFSIYKKDIKFIRNMSGKEILDDNQIKLVNILEDSKDYTLEEFDNYIYSLDNEFKIKEVAFKLIKFLQVKIINNIETNENYCNKNFKYLLDNIKFYNESDNIKIFVDADKSRFNLYPIIQTICDIIFTNSNKEFYLITSIIDDYDSASTSKLVKMITQIKEKYKDAARNIKIIYIEKNTININLSFNNKQLIQLICNSDKALNKNPGLKIEQFFSINFNELRINKFNYDSSLGNISREIDTILNDNSNYKIIYNRFYNIVYSSNNQSIIDSYIIKNRYTNKLKYNLKGLKDNNSNLFEDIEKAYYPIFYYNLTTNILSTKDKIIKNELQNFLNYLSLNVFNLSKGTDINIENFQKINYYKYQKLIKKSGEIPEFYVDFINYIFTRENKIDEIFAKKVKTKYIYDTTDNKYYKDDERNKLLKKLINQYEPIFNYEYNNIYIIEEKLNALIEFSININKDDANIVFTELSNRQQTSLSYYKTCGDLSQILYCNGLSNKDNKSTYLFLSFDKIATYISSLFNYGTLQENNEDPFVPMKLFTSYSRTTIKQAYSLADESEQILEQLKKRLKTSFGKKNNYNANNIKTEAEKYGIPIKNKTKKIILNEIKIVIENSKKYGIKLDNKTYQKLFTLYKLHLLAKKYKINLTKKIKGKKVYKNNKELAKEIIVKKNI